MLTEQRPQRLQYPRQVQEFFLEMEARPPRNLSSVFPDLPAGVLAIARRMLDLDPETRPTPLQLLNDPFFADMHSDRKLADSPRFASELHDMSFSDRKKVRSQGFPAHMPTMPGPPPLCSPLGKVRRMPCQHNGHFGCLVAPRLPFVSVRSSMPGIAYSILLPASLCSILSGRHHAIVCMCINVRCDISFPSLNSIPRHNVL